LAGLDYTSISSDEVFLSGSIDGDNVCVDITLLPEDPMERDETFTVTLTTTDPGVTLGTNVTTITIDNNEGKCSTIVRHVCKVEAHVSHVSHE
jgi:hypothetical protein